MFLFSVDLEAKGSGALDATYSAVWGAGHGLCGRCMEQQEKSQKTFQK